MQGVVCIQCGWWVNVTAVYTVVLAAGEDHHVPAGATLHHGGARMLADNVLCARWAPWTHATHDQDLQQRGTQSPLASLSDIFLCGTNVRKKIKLKNRLGDELITQLVKTVAQASHSEHHKFELRSTCYFNYDNNGFWGWFQECLEL